MAAVPRKTNSYSTDQPLGDRRSQWLEKLNFPGSTLCAGLSCDLTPRPRLSTQASLLYRDSRLGAGSQGHSLLLAHPGQPQLAMAGQTSKLVCFFSLLEQHRFKRLCGPGTVLPPGERVMEKTQPWPPGGPALAERLRVHRVLTPRRIRAAMAANATGTGHAHRGGWGPSCGMQEARPGAGGANAPNFQLPTRKFSL